MSAFRCSAALAACRRCTLPASSSSRASTFILARPVGAHLQDARASQRATHSIRCMSSRSCSNTLRAPRWDTNTTIWPSHDVDLCARFFSTSLTAAAKKKAKGKSSSSTPNADDSASSASRYPPLPDGWQAVIGVECHVQIKHKHKLFSTAQLPTPSSIPNTHVTAFDAAHPGTFPTLNRSALRLAARTALALDCRVHPESRFDRKHYFYSDLPAGYQITQKYAPLANNGKVKLSFDEGNLPSPEDEVVVEIEQLQLEQDTAKSSYFDTGTTSRFDQGASSTGGGNDDGTPKATLHESDDERVGRSFVDLNRAGAGLMEIVSGPQMRTPEQAGAYVRKLQELVRRVGASDGNMQEGSLRCDVNVSVNRVGEPFGTRCEVKNLNSVRFMMNAISYESHRQVQLLQQQGCVEQETRGYNESNGTTFRLRGKEDAPDYRYMPDPNLPPILLSQQQIQALRDDLPELPDARRARLSQQYGLAPRDINVLMRVGSEDERDGRVAMHLSDGDAPQTSSDAVEYFESVASGRNPQTALNWIIHELMKGLNARNLPFREWFLPADYLGQLIDLVESGQVTGTTAKSVVAHLLSSAQPDGKTEPLITLAALRDTAQRTSTPMLELLRQNQMLALATEEDLLPLVQSALERLPDEVAQVKKGNVKVAMRIVGQVMKDANGRADAKLVHQTILQQLGQGPPS